MSLSVALEMCCKDFAGSESENRVARFVKFFRGSKLAMLIVMSMGVMTMLGAVNADNLADAVSSLSGCGACYTCFAGHRFFRTRKTSLGRLLGQLHDLAARLEQHGSEKVQLRHYDGQVVLRRYGQLLNFCFNAIYFYGVTSVGFLILDALFTLHPVVPVYPMPESSWGVIAVAFFEAFGWTLCGTAFFPFFCLITNHVLALVGLYCALCEHMQGTRGMTEVLSSVRLHQELSTLARETRLMYEKDVLHTLGGVFATPLFGTIQLVNGPRTAFMIATLPCLPVVFLPLATLSEDLSGYSGGMSSSAYRGNWLEEDLPTRRCLLLIMLRSTRPDKITVRGLGDINLPSAFAALKSWYTYLQILMNFQV